ncbi:MAG: hypothetical protein H9Q65_00340 [Spiroplasma ixodetis]|nr:hypothetical protein [Spiroplasma ixodetis]MBP1526412.1 hypothetical protein [Spiroplasma ixodetis]MBP1527694.1 hypothetical protein [Spiroplasma ixodetis]
MEYKPLLKKMWNLVELKKAKKLEMEDLKEIDFHNINSRVLKNYLSSQKNIPFDEIRPSFEQNINIIKIENCLIKLKKNLMQRVLIIFQFQLILEIK